jgi:hypothetical protein
MQRLLMRRITPQRLALSGPGRYHIKKLAERENQIGSHVIIEPSQGIWQLD